MTIYDEKKVAQWKMVAEMIQDQASLDQIEYIEKLQHALARARMETWIPIDQLNHKNYVLLLNNETGLQSTGFVEHVRDDGELCFQVYQSSTSIYIQTGFTHFMELPTVRPE